MSLDGYIAGRAGELSYLVADPAYDQRAFFAGVDTVLMGRRTYEVALRHGGGGFPGLRAYVFSRTLRPADHPGVTVVASEAAAVVAELRAEDGSKEIWLAGGGDLLAGLLVAGVVDTVEVGISPVLLGNPARRWSRPCSRFPSGCR